MGEVFPASDATKNGALDALSACRDAWSAASRDPSRAGGTGGGGAGAALGGDAAASWLAGAPWLTPCEHATVVETIRGSDARSDMNATW
jgi:hypothetical protein